MNTCDLSCIVEIINDYNNEFCVLTCITMVCICHHGNLLMYHRGRYMPTTYLQIGMQSKNHS